MSEEKIVGMYEFLEAVEDAIQSSNPKQRAALAKVCDEYANGELSEEFFWAVGAQSPTLLSHLMMAIDNACRTEPKHRPVLRLVDRKPEGTA